MSVGVCSILLLIFVCFVIILLRKGEKRYHIIVNVLGVLILIGCIYLALTFLTLGSID